MWVESTKELTYSTFQEYHLCLGSTLCLNDFEQCPSNKNDEGSEIHRAGIDDN